MSIPMTADEIIRQLKRWGVPYHEMPNWRTYGRDKATGKPFGPVYGCVTHHTGDDAPDSVDRSVVANGRTGLPGPLAHFGIADDGTVDLHSCHRANHAGGGDPNVLSAVKAESYVKYPPATHYHEGSPGAVDGNDIFYGCECYYSGSHRMTGPQYGSLVRLWAAICEFHKWTAKSVIGHKEWSDWKPDPGSLDMYQLRVDVQHALDVGPNPVLPDTRVTKAGQMLDQVIAILLEVPDNRPLVTDIREKIIIQRARLPRR